MTVILLRLTLDKGVAAQRQTAHTLMTQQLQDKQPPQSVDAAGASALPALTAVAAAVMEAFSFSAASIERGQEGHGVTHAGSAAPRAQRPMRSAAAADAACQNA